MSKKPPKADHGSFALNSPEEGVLLVQLAERAAKNHQKPGQAWGRFDGKREVDGRTETGIKLFHLDLNTNTLTITEEWDGRETARKRVDLNANDNEPAPSGPTGPPDPGPTAPSFFRLPFRAADLLPEEDLREWAMTRAEEDVRELSILPRRIRLFGEGFQEVVALPEPFAPNVAPGTGATVHALAKRPGVERRLVEGWFGSVDGRGTAWILELGDEGEWWIAMRTFERRPGMIGRWTSAWSIRAGRGPDGITSSLRVVLTPPPDEQAIVVGAPKAPQAPDLGMFGGTLPPTEAPPDTADGVADRVGREWELVLARGESPAGPRLTVFRGQEWETWKVEGEFPMGLDDMIRAISARGELPTSMALVRMGVLEFEGNVYRALMTEGEAQGRRYTRAMLIALAPDGTVLGHRIVAHDRGEVGDDGWIGVAPITEMSLFVIGAGEA